VKFGCICESRIAGGLTLEQRQTRAGIRYGFLKRVYLVAQPGFLLLSCRGFMAQA